MHRRRTQVDRASQDSDLDAWAPLREVHPRANGHGGVHNQEVKGVEGNNVVQNVRIVHRQHEENLEATTGYSADGSAKVRSAKHDRDATRAQHTTVKFRRQIMRHILTNPKSPLV